MNLNYKVGHKFMDVHTSFNCLFYFIFWKKTCLKSFCLLPRNISINAPRMGPQSPSSKNIWKVQWSNFLTTYMPQSPFFDIQLYKKNDQGIKMWEKLTIIVNSLASVPNLSQVVKYSEVRVSNPHELCLYLN